MPRGLAWVLAGAFAGLGVLFFTIWSGSEDSASMAAIMFAVASVMIVSSELRPARKDRCPDKARDQTPAD